MKLKKVVQAEVMVSMLERKLGDKLTSRKKTILRKAFDKLEDTPYPLINVEISKLREMVFLIDVDREVA